MIIPGMAPVNTRKEPRRREGIAVLEPDKKKKKPGFGGGKIPPMDYGNGGGGGGGGGNGDDGEEWRPRMVTVRLGFYIFMGAICLLFFSLLGAYAVLRQRAEQWPPPGSPQAPEGLWVTIPMLLLASWTMHRAGFWRRQGEAGKTRNHLLLTLLLGLIFLTTQIVLWRHGYLEGLRMQLNPFGAIFYSLTGLHALHIVGGLFFLAHVTGGVIRGRFLEGYVTPVDFCGVYWHFMDVLWIVVYCFLVF